METKFIEATNVDAGGINWGKFMVGLFTAEEWNRRSAVREHRSMLDDRGWTGHHIFVMDLQTGEGAMFRHGGLARADLRKHGIWRCPLFEPFLAWLYDQPLESLMNLPAHVKIEDAQCLAFVGPNAPGALREGGWTLMEEMFNSLDKSKHDHDIDAGSRGGIFRPREAWCPKCLAEAVKSGSYPHVPKACEHAES